MTAEHPTETEGYASADWTFPAYGPGAANDPPDPTADELRMLAEALELGGDDPAETIMQLRRIADRIDGTP